MHDGILSVAASSDTGKVRQDNEDSFKVAPDKGLLILSDGMGGHNAGRIASFMVVEALAQVIESVLPSLPPSDSEAHLELLKHSVTVVSREIWKRSRGQPGMAGMGATLVLGLFRGRSLFIAHMGDSRAYLFRNGRLSLLTDDHSITGLMVREGLITPEEAEGHPARGMLSHYMGMEGEVYPEVREVFPESGDRLLLCTDGLTGELADGLIEEILALRTRVDRVCAELIDRACEGAARDNITVIVAEWLEDADKLDPSSEN